MASSDMRWLVASDMRAWDDFQMHAPRGHYCQLSTWLDSFRAFGARPHVLAISDHDEIVGGIGLLEFRTPVFTAVVAPAGPCVDDDDDAATLIDEAVRWAKARGAALIQFNLPHAEAPLPYLLKTRPTIRGAVDGTAFRTGVAPAQMLWVPIPEVDWRESLLRRFNANTRRNIRAALDGGLEVAEASVGELEAAYAVIEANGREQGYDVRSWAQFGSTLTAQVERGHAIVHVARLDGQLVGTHYGVLAGRRYSYIMGGTVRTEPDVKVGHRLHWAAIERAAELGLDGYDLTSGGSPGVMRFKMGFRPDHIQFDGRVHVTLRPLRARAYATLEPHVRKHRAKLAKVAGRLR